MKKLAALLFALFVGASTPVGVEADVSFVMLNNVSTTGTHTCIPIGTTLNKSFQIVITGTATVSIQLSADGCATTPITVATVTATSWISTDFMANGVRANVTVCTGCTVTAKMVAGVP